MTSSPLLCKGNLTFMLCTHLNTLVEVTIISIYQAGEKCLLHNLIGSSISEYPAIFTSEQNKMASSFVSVTEEVNCFEQTKPPCQTIPKK